jgi:hypothetical protein
LIENPVVGQIFWAVARPVQLMLGAHEDTPGPPRMVVLIEDRGDCMIAIETDPQFHSPVLFSPKFLVKRHQLFEGKAEAEAYYQKRTNDIIRRAVEEARVYSEGEVDDLLGRVLELVR